MKHCRELSIPNNSISQVVPAIMSIRNFIASNSMGYRFQKRIRDSFTTSFKEITSGPSQDRYDIATLLDPRFAYRDTVYTAQTWRSLEKKVIDDFVNSDLQNDKNFYQDISILNQEQRYDIIKKEFAYYRQTSFVERPEENENSNHWWGMRQTDMEFLAVIAREYLASPAVSIDAGYYFGNGGKFQHICHTYSHQRLENCLALAGNYQTFRGKGASVDVISQSMIETLNNTASRLQKQVHLGLYAHGVDNISSDRDVQSIVGHHYPPMPTVANYDIPHVPKEEEKPPVANLQSTSSPATSSPTIIRPRAAPPPRTLAQGRPIPLNGKELKAVPIRQIPLQVRPLPPRPANVPIVPRPTVPQQFIKAPAPKPITLQAVVCSIPEKEIKKETEDVALLEKIKDEPLDEDDFNHPSTDPVPNRTTASSQGPSSYPRKIVVLASKLPTSQSSSPSTATSAQARSHVTTAQLIRCGPSEGTVPQKIHSHNFVQKFAQKQNFVHKYALNSQDHTGRLNQTVPMRAALRLPNSEQKSGAPSSINGKVQRDDFKLEPLDDFNGEPDYDNLIGAQRLMYSDNLNDASAEDAFAR